MPHIPCLRVFLFGSLLGWGLLPAQAAAQGTPLREIMDAEIRTAWQRDKISPAGPADDATFLRRIYLDLIGTIPTYEEAQAFLADKGPGRRAQLIDRLLDDPRFARQQADVWENVLISRKPPGDVASQRQALHGWLTEKFAKNERYDRWVRELLLAEGTSRDNGTPLFYVQFRSRPEEAAMAVSRIFLGTQLQCAQCHDDRRDDKWTQLDFYGFAAFFNRLVVIDRADKGKTIQQIAEKSSGEMMFSGPAAEQEAGKKGKPVPAKFLDGRLLPEPPLPKDFKEAPLKDGRVPPAPLFSRKQKLAEWVTAPDNPYFARAIANRVWAQFMGRGLVHPLDDLRDKQPASHPKLFQVLHQQLAAHRFDLKWLIRELVNSQTYQLSDKGDAGPPASYRRARLRPLTGEEMLSAVREASGFDAAIRASGKKPSEVKPPSGLDYYFPQHFNDSRSGDFQGSLQERLFMNHSTRVRDLIQQRKGNLADTLLASSEPWAKRVDRLFLTVLTRLPRAEERTWFVEHLTSDPKQPGPLVEEAIWVLLNTSEFRFNH